MFYSDIHESIGGDSTEDSMMQIALVVLRDLSFSEGTSGTPRCVMSLMNEHP